MTPSDSMPGALFLHANGEPCYGCQICLAEAFDNDQQGIAEHCYRPGCDNWVTGASNYCSPQCGEQDPHEFSQMVGIMVNACVHCGKWPMHHIHDGISMGLCTCDACRKKCRHED